MAWQEMSKDKKKKFHKYISSKTKKTVLSYCLTEGKLFTAKTFA